MSKIIHVLCFFVVMTQFSCGQKTDKEVETPAETQVSKEMVVPGLQLPWGLDFLPDGSMLITEKAGQLIHYKDGQKTEVENVPKVYVRGQGGLLDVAVHPDYESNGWIYLTFASEEGQGKGGNTALVRAKLQDGALTSIEKLYKAEPNTTRGQHFGSRIVFQDGFVYFTIGERGERDVNPQDITRDGGKVYRLNADGSIPQDNPFVGEENAKEAIYTYGNRNPQGMVIHPGTGEIWIHEHGPRGGDEINVVEKGANYGWPVITYGINYSGTPITDKTKQEGMKQPIHYWDPSIAPSGMAFITSDKYPGWKGDLLVGSLSFQYLERLVMNGKEVVKREKLFPEIGRVREVTMGPDGYIYFGVEGKGIYRLLPSE